VAKPDETVQARHLLRSGRSRDGLCGSGIGALQSREWYNFCIWNARQAISRRAPVDRWPAQVRAPSPFALIAVRGTTFFAGPSNNVFGVDGARSAPKFARILDWAVRDYEWATPGVFEKRPVVTVTASDDYFPQRKNSARFLPRFDTSISQPGLPCPGDG
jgi:predicted alpha-1,6-mannanase (GH76 family)